MSRHRVYSMDELELDALSGNSYGLQNSGTRFSDSECNVGGQRSVRDIIEHYNRQSNDRDSNVTTVRRHRSRAGADVCEALSSMGSAHRHMMLPTTKSSYFGLNNFNSETQFSASAKKTPSNITTCCKNCSACMCCHNRSHNSFMSFEDVEALPPPPPINENVYLKKSVATVNIANCGSKEQLLNTVVYNTAEDENAQQHYHQQQYRHLHNHKQFAVSHLNGPTKQSAATNDTKAEADYQPLETSYQSKTTIAKTSSGWLT